MNDLRNRRILVIDDNSAIHEDFRKILAGNRPSSLVLDQEVEELLGASKPLTRTFAFKLESAFQGEEALEKVRQALAAGEPHAMAFVDMRMPPGWDGVETIRRIWQVQPDLEVVICTAHSDYSWQEIQHSLGVSDRLLILKKPFDNVEVQQLALAVTEKWNLRNLARLHTEGLSELVRLRTRETLRAHQSKCEFLANVGHELLTPMNSILSTAGQLGATPLNDAQKHLLTDLQQSGQRLLGLLNDVLTFNSIESGKFNLQAVKFDLRALCDSILQDHAAKAGGKGLELKGAVHANLPSQAQGYPDHIRQVLVLLLDNAIKFTDQGSISLDIQPAAPWARTVEFSVTDTGRGISTEQMASLRHPFSQVESGQARKAGGIGMGLTLAKQLVDLMGGWLEFSSKPGQGSTFSFTLSLAQENNAPSSAGAGQGDAKPNSQAA